jgi:hypothetical protein
MIHSYDTLLAACQSVFLQARTYALFRQLVEAWVLCTTRRTLTGLLPFIPAAERRAHDAYHYFFRRALWNPDLLFDVLLRVLVRTQCPDGRLPLDLDDTLHHKTGRKVDGAGWWRDAVHSTGTRTVTAWGLNLVVLTLRITPPWGGMPLGLPVRVRVHRKGGPTPGDLAVAMLTSVAAAVPGCRLAVCADGFYAFLAAQLPPAIPFTSRMRRDAVLHDELGYRPQGTRGRKPTKGPKLPKPPALAEEAGRLHLFSLTTITRCQQQGERLVYARRVWWDGVWVRLVIVRDPDGQEPDDYFFTTDLDACALDVPEHYWGRWSIELTFRDTKQLLGGQEPQSWAGWGPEQTAAFAYGLHTLIWTCFLLASPAEQQQALRPWPWYPQKTTPSFADALACLRRALWQRRFTARAEENPALGIISQDVEVLIDHASRAA